MLSLIIVMAIVGLSGVVVGLIGIYLYRRGSCIWEEDRKRLSLTKRIPAIFYLFLEMRVFERNKYYKEAAARHLAIVYDYLVIREPDMFLANQVLREGTVLEILNYCDAPGGRIFKLRVGATKKHLENTIIININAIANEAYKIKDKDMHNKPTKLRVIK